MGDPRHTLRVPSGDPDTDPDPDLDREKERNPRNLSTSRSRSGDVPEMESRLKCFASTGSMLRPMDALPECGVEPRLGLGTGLELGVGGVAGAGVSFAVSEEDAEADAEALKRESLDSPRAMMPVLVSVCVFSPWSCPSCALALEMDAETEAETDIVTDIEESRCSKNRVSCEHLFPFKGLHLQVIDPSNGVDATRGSKSDGESGVPIPYLGSVCVSLNGVSSLLVASLKAGVSVSELVLAARSERRIMMSGVWNEVVSIAVFPEMSETGPTIDPVGRRVRIGEKAKRRNEERAECAGTERLDAVEGMRRCPFP